MTVPFSTVASVCSLVAAATSSVPDGQYVGSLRQRLTSPVTAAFDSTKKPYDLELCVADVLNVIGTPIALRDGPKDVVILPSVGPGKFIASVSLLERPTGTRVEFRVQGKAWDDRLRERLLTCR